MEQKLDKILQKLETLENKYITLEQKLSDVTQKVTIVEKAISKIEQSTQNMDDHIDFVETVYNVVKNPVSSLLKLYYQSYNNEQIESPEIPQMKRIKHK